MSRYFDDDERVNEQEMEEMYAEYLYQLWMDDKLEEKHNEQLRLLRSDEK